MGAIAQPPIAKWMGAGTGDLQYRPGLHALALLTVLATYALVILGGTVTSRGAGLAVPDWPTTFERNMFLFPPELWKGGVLWEHTHRLLGSLVGLLTIGLTLAVTWNEARRPGRWAAACAVVAVVGTLIIGALAQRQFTLAFAAVPAALLAAAWLTVPDARRPGVALAAWVFLALVVIQGFLGGLRVTQTSIALAIAHGVTGQLFLCLAVFLAAVTSRWWIEQAAAPEAGATGAVPVALRRLRGVALVVFAVVLVQLILGATMRHTGAGLAIPDFPASYGGVLPPFDQAGIEAATKAQAAPQTPHTFYGPGQVGLAFAHRTWALAVVAGVVGLAGLTLRQTRGLAMLQRPAAALVGLMAVQFLLGAVVIWSTRQPELTTAHQAVGAAVLATVGLLALRLWRVEQLPVTERGVEGTGA